jgi:AraC-like DNA-binding protein
VIDGQILLRLVFGAAGASAYLVLALVALRAEGSRALRIALVFASLLSALGLIVDSPIGQTLDAVQPALALSLKVMAAGVPGALWLALTTMFRDRDANWHHALPLLGLMGAAAVAYHGGDLAWAFFWLWTGGSVLLVVHGMFVVISTGNDDLVESRRRLRFWLSAMCILGCGVLLMLLLTNAADARRFALPGWWPTTLRGLMAATAIATVALVLDPRRQLLPPQKKPARATEVDADLLRDLEAAMTTERLWRQEGLTLAKLASQLNSPEYKLRLLINGRLGHRNFTEFVNGFRVEAAKVLLADDHSGLNVAQVAYEVGFSSLAPFNRAFKEVTGVTPTQWRKGMLIES